MKRSISGRITMVLTALSALLLAAVLMLPCAVYADAASVEDYTKFWTGSGTVDEPYVISDEDGWKALAGYTAEGFGDKDDVFCLGGDIEVKDVIGSYEHPFTGTFDGA